VQAWLLGSGIDQTQRDTETTRALCDALEEGVPVVVDSGALDLVGRAAGPVVITPHFRELARLLSADAEQIAADPEFWCTLAAESLGITVLLKGSRTRIAGQDGTRLVTGTATGWLASAGTGDVLGGILGALIATHADAIADNAGLPAHLAATAALIHAEAGELASSGGPLAALDVAAAVPEVVAQLLRGNPRG
jgi:NAD(P)H-hydrate repair Nnr-like enzyme with NAD(P)H-hydrate dehydratase domain